MQCIALNVLRFIEPAKANRTRTSQNTTLHCIALRAISGERATGDAHMVSERPQISVRFTKTEQKRLQRIAHADGRSRAQWVRWVTLKALAEAEKKLAAAGKETEA